MNRLIKTEFIEQELNENNLEDCRKLIYEQYNKLLEPSIKIHVETGYKVLMIAFNSASSADELIFHCKSITLKNKSIEDSFLEIEKTFYDVKYIKIAIVKNRGVFEFISNNLIDTKKVLDIIITKDSVKWVYPN